MKKEKVEKGSKKKDADAPKRPAGAFFIFMKEFRKSFKLEFYDVKSGPTEKAPYVEKASRRKADYEIAVKEYEKKKLDCNVEAQKYPAKLFCPCKDCRSVSHQSSADILEHLVIRGWTHVEVTNRIAKRLRGFAFLCYETEEESWKAIEEMHGK